MEAPKKIYILNHIDYSDRRILNAFTEKENNNDVEYTRVDVLLDKALKFLDGCIPDYIELKHANVDTFMDVDNERFIKDFINHMKEG